MSTSLISLYSIPGVGKRRRETLMRKMMSQPSVIFFGLLLIVITVLCALAPVIAPDPNAASFAPFIAPSAEHPLGTDHLGRDLLARALHGGSTSLIVGFAVGAICLTVGMFLGGLAGYYGGFADTVLTKITEFFQVIPGIVLALAATAILGGSVGIIIVILSLTMWPQVARIMRAEAMRISELGYIESAKAVGFHSFRTFCVDVIPNAFPPVLVATTMTVGRAILIESALSFLGLGDANTPSWGALLHAAQQFIQNAWWLSVFPGLAIFIVVLSANMLGDRLNDALNPTLSRVKS